jgi:aspartate/methionine/tyrosine aminotransferase
MLVLADPANPSGGCLAEEDLDHIAWIAAAYDVLVFADESLAAFRYGNSAKPFGRLAGAERRIVTAGSVTQEFGLDSLRVGWLAGPRHLVRACGLTQNLSAPFVPAACQQAAARVISESADDAAALDSLKGKRDYTVDRLRAMGLEIDPPAGGLVAWVPVAGLGLDGRTFAERLFRDYQVQVGPGCAFGPSGVGHVRVSFAGDDGRLREGLSRMAAFVARLRNPAASVPDKPADDVAADEPQQQTAADAPKPAFSRA